MCRLVKPLPQQYFNLFECNFCLKSFIVKTQNEKERITFVHIDDNISRSQWSSGSTLACGARGHRFESRCGQKFVFSRKSLRYAALSTGCSLTAVPRSTQPSTLRGTVNEYNNNIIIRNLYSAIMPLGGYRGALWLSNNTSGDGRMFGF